MSLICPIVFTCIGAVLVVLGAVLGWAVFPSIVEDEIIKQVRLENGTDQWDRWEELPFPLDFKVVFFSIENPDEVIQGGKPNFTEIGPYYYKQFRHKENITNADGDLEYYQITSFVFDEEKSKPLLETDTITMLNVPFNAIIQRLAANLVIGEYSKYLDEIFLGNTEIFLKTTPKEFLFDGVKLCVNGEPKIQCDILKASKPKTMRIDTDGTAYIALFAHKQDKHDGLYRVKTGQQNIQDLGKIVQWNKDDRINMWKGGKNSTCNMINGTDNTIYAPFLKRTDLKVFNTDICRSVTTRYEKDVEYKGITAYRFLGKEDILPFPSKESNNDCFCMKKTVGIQNETTGCLLDGVMELYPCFDSHVVLSFPHFLMADEVYRNGVDGMKPDPNIHQIFLDVEPNTGVPVRGGKRVQFNMFIRPIRKVDSTSNLNTTLVPFIWVDEGMELPDFLVNELNESLFDKLVIIDAVKWTLIAVGCALFIAFIIVIIYKKKRAKTV